MREQLAPVVTDDLGLRRRASEVGRLSVTAADGVAALERFSTQIDQLNRVSARPTAFHSAAFLRCYALQSEYSAPGAGARLYQVWDDDRLVACAPLRRATKAFGPSWAGAVLRGMTLQFLAAVDIEQPSLLCAPEHQDRVAAALVDHLCRHEPHWGMLEFAGQRPGGALHRAMHAVANPAFRVRDIAVEPYNEIALIWPDLVSYFRSLSKKMRSNISRQARRLFASGHVELILATKPQAVAAWFTAYCDLDTRSWKHGTKASINRDPRRVRFFREIVAGRAGFDPSFIGIVLDGVLVAGLIVGADPGAPCGGRGAWCLEMAYDRGYAELGPGQLLLLMAVGEAIGRGDAFLNFLQNFAYYKHRWNAEAIEVVNVQLIRKFSLHDARGRLGEFKPWSARLMAQRSPPGSGDPEPQETAPRRPGPTGSPPDRAQARCVTAEALAYAGVGVRRLQGQAARGFMPFSVD